MDNIKVNTNRQDKRSSKKDKQNNPYNEKHIRIITEIKSKSVEKQKTVKNNSKKK